MLLMKEILTTQKNNLKSDSKSAVNKVISKLMKIFKMKLINRYGYFIEFNFNLINIVTDKFIKVYDKKYSSRQTDHNGLLYDTVYIISLDTNTYCYICAGSPLSDNKEIIDLFEDSSRDNSSNYSFGTKLKLYIFGKHANKYMKILKKSISISNTNSLKTFNVTSNKNDINDNSFQSTISDMKPRSLDSLFYEEGVKESVTDHIDNWIASRSLYESKNINYKTSLLLYGPPGTGKTSLVNAICDHYKYDMIIVDINTFNHLDTNILKQCINGDSRTYVVLLEDIDTVFNLNRNSKNGSIGREDKKVINKLLQFLDSNSSPNNVIFVCTTNHIDVLDEAIMRRGRIDKNIYIGPIKTDIAKEMCKSFDLTDEQTDKVITDLLSTIPDTKDGSEKLINQSSLQARILDEFREVTLSKSDIIDVNKVLEETKNSTVEIKSENDELDDNELNEEQPVNDETEEKDEDKDQFE